jgi:hypothetical protein
MLTFKEYLEEAILKPWKEKDIDTKKLTKRLSETHSNWLSAVTNGGLLFRGQHDIYGEVRQINPAKGLRSSRDTNNIYQLAMDISPAMKLYPSRGKSLICSTTPSGASTYGYAYALIPENEAKIAVSEEGDFLEQTIHDSIVADEIRAFGPDLQGLVKDCGGKVKDTFETAAELNKIFSKLNAKKFTTALVARASNTIDSGAEAMLLKEFERNVNNRFDYLAADSMSPLQLDLRLAPYGSFLSDKSVECWVSSKCLMIPMKIFKGMMQELDKSGHEIYRKYASMAWQT